MRPAEIANQEIIEAGKKLQSTGKNITGYGLRRVLGAGDPKRLKFVWDEYVSKDKSETNDDLRLPAELEDLVIELEKNIVEQVRPIAIQLYDGALKAAQRQVSETSRELKQLKSEIEAEILDANAIIEDLEQRLTDASQRLAATSEELKQSQEARYEFERQAITLEAEVKHLRENSTYEELMKRIVALESRGHNG
ncbi:plasmid replication DNA-binding protein KfrA [Marinobacter pelagius]|uniref:Plasmid replication DNA-binding protein KfrA n=1 Tax=Marinobacter pelagius TaxID=379482 RepID=A0A366GSM3_9GAMM|nr:DNA-binding protein [Marinobacter pelagius]RBP30724.1 plasmid replication DNA-binding protein KfrA [Marinobacter pelagius]